MSVQDFELLTPGMILGIIITHNNEHLDADERGETVRMANQADFDKF